MAQTCTGSGFAWFFEYGKRVQSTQHTAAIQVQLGDGWQEPQSSSEAPGGPVAEGQRTRRLGELESLANDPTLEAAPKAPG
jgi:hypothetical protein